MNWGQFIVQWLHVGLGVLWFGTVLYTATILIPALSGMPLRQQREVGRAIGEHASGHPPGRRGGHRLGILSSTSSR